MNETLDKKIEEVERLASLKDAGEASASDLLSLDQLLRSIAPALIAERAALLAKLAAADRKLAEAGERERRLRSALNLIKHRCPVRRDPAKMAQHVCSEVADAALAAPAETQGIAAAPQPAKGEQEQPATAPAGDGWDAKPCPSCGGHLVPTPIAGLGRRCVGCGCVLEPAPPIAASGERQTPKCPSCGGDMIPNQARSGHYVCSWIACRGEFVVVNCRACGAPLLPQNHWIADGCRCNSARGVNHGIVPADVCTCPECDPAQTGASRRRPILQEPKP